jgi:hypothetical protein
MNGWFITQRGTPMQRFGRKFVIKMGWSGALAVAVLGTLLVPNWIELVFAVDPDDGDGLIEWGLAVVLGIAAIAFLARVALKLRVRRPLRKGATNV